MGWDVSQAEIVDGGLKIITFDAERGDALVDGIKSVF